MRLAIFLILFFHVCALFGGASLQIEARVCPEKEEYILGEPIFLNIEVVNHSEKPVVLDSR